MRRGDVAKNGVRPVCGMHARYVCAVRARQCAARFTVRARQVCGQVRRVR